MVPERFDWMCTVLTKKIDFTFKKRRLQQMSHECFCLNSKYDQTISILIGFLLKNVCRLDERPNCETAKMFVVRSRSFANFANCKRPRTSEMKFLRTMNEREYYEDLDEQTRTEILLCVCVCVCCVGMKWHCNQIAENKRQWTNVSLCIIFDIKCSTTSSNIKHNSFASYSHLNA